MKVTASLVLGTSCCVAAPFAQAAFVASHRRPVWGTSLSSTKEPEKTKNEESFLDQAFEDEDPVSYHKGGNSRYTEPMVKPARLSIDDDEEECEAPFFDLATGDELCWGEAPKHPKNVVAQSKKNVEAVTRPSPKVADDYHKGGNAQFQSVGSPTKLDDDDEECEVPFFDFVSGDELCWNDKKIKK